MPAAMHPPPATRWRCRADSDRERLRVSGSALLAIASRLTSPARRGDNRVARGHDRVFARLMASDRHWQLGLRTVTDLGDAAILIPLAAAILASLLLDNARCAAWWAGASQFWLGLAAAILVWLLLVNARCAAWWAGAILFCVGLTAALKIDFHGCPPAPDLHSPSGHTGLSVLVYGAITLAAAQEQRGPRWVLVIIAGGGLIAAIAASRLLLGVHSLAEIGLGLVIGLVSVALFGRVYRRVSHRPVWPLLIAAGVLAAMLHGRELRAEEFLARLTGYFGIHC